MALEILPGLERFLRRGLDRDLAEIIAVGESPFFECQFMREALLRQFPAQHANLAQNMERPEIDPPLVELAQEALLALREELGDRPLSLRDFIDLIALLHHRQRRRADHPVADTISFQFESLQLLPLLRNL